ncbi:MAG TPA: hypothetical protein VLM37_02325, partial [Fibrobacteraceae bacterium]|nr:hypothetical protein [Fibrobacteraceae bacterium]
MSSFLIQGLLFAVAFSWAGSYTAFMLDDFGGAETDSLQVDTGLSTGLRVGVETSLFLKVLDTALNDATTESGSYENYGANPLVVATEDGSFRALYLHYYNVSGGPDPSANHHYLWSVDLLNKTLSNQITAGTNNFHYKDVYADIYASGDKPNPVPVFAHFEANSSRWLALWSNDTVKSGPVVYSTWNDPYPTGATYFHFLKWPSGAYLRGTVLDFNYLRVAFAALDDRMEDVVCIHGPSRTQTTYGNTAKIFVRWERPTDTSIYAIDSQAVSSGTSSAHVGLYHVAVAVDSDKRVLAGWTNYSAQTLYLQAYDSSYSSGTITRLGSLTSFPSTLDTGLTTMDTLYRNFAIQNLQEDLFLVAYARSNQICYRMVDISGGAPSVSSETVVSLAGERCRFPDIAVNQNWVAFSFFRDTTDGKIPEAVVFRRSGTTLTDSMVVSYGRVTFNTLADGYATPMSTTSNSRYQHVRHLSQPGRVAVALDSAGALLLGFNQERNARLAGYRNCDVYFDTATWFSQALDLRGDSVDYTMESGDSVRFLSTSLSGTSTTYAQLLLSRNDTLVATPGSTAYEASATWRYRIQMARVDSFTTPEVTSAQIVWNLQPRKPQITGVRVGTSQSSLQSFSETTRYDVVNRRDSVWVFFSAWDLDNPADLTLHVRTSYVSPRNGVAQSFSFSQDVSGLTRTGDGSFSGTLLISPQDLLADSLVLSFSAQDSLWEGDARPLLLRYLNKLPSDALRILWKDGQGGSLDSAVTTGAVVRVQMDDSALVKVSASDSNDASLTVSWTISGLSGSNQSGSTTLSLTDTARIWIPWDLYDRNPANLPEGDSLELTPDTLTLSIQDPDTTLSQMLRFLPNHKPRLDSVSAVGFYQDGEYRDTLVGRWRHGDDPSYLTVPPGVPVRLIRHVREVDRVNGDSFSGVWQVLLQDTTDKTLWQIDTSATGDTLLYSFPSNPETQLAMLRLVETDLSGTMTED